MKPPVHIQQAIQAYYAERATDEDIEALESWFREDIAHIRLFAEHGMIEWQMLCEQQKLDAAAVLAILREAEDNADVDLSQLDLPVLETASKTDDHQISHREFCSLACHFAAHGLRTRAGVLGSIAAVILLGTILYLVLLGVGGAPDTPQVVHNKPVNPQDQKAVAIEVATLTAQHDAVWSSGPGSEQIDVGNDLKAGQRLSLVEGFAEISMNRGAKAFLEAPCTIVLTDDDNALFLASGNLLAYVPPSAMGFTVHTRNTQIVDLGTRFGVGINANGDTALEVFSGKISVAPIIAGRLETASTITQGRTAVARTGEAVLEEGVVDQNASRFEKVSAFEQMLKRNKRMAPWLNDDSLVAYYGFEQGTGQTLRESRGNGLFDAQIEGARWEAGRLPGKYALDFTDPNDRFTLSRQASDRIEVEEAFTISFWLKFQELEGSWFPLMSRGNDSWRIKARRNGQQLLLGFYISSPAPGNEDAHVGVTTDNIETNRWHHIVVTTSKTEGGTKTGLYLDGRMQTGWTTPSVPDSDRPVVFGANPEIPSEFSFNGLIDEVALFGRALTEEEVQNLYRAGLPDPPGDPTETTN